MKTTANYTKARRISDYRYTFPGQFREQTAYFRLDTRTGDIVAMHNPEIGGAITFAEYNGIDRRYSFNPYLKMGTVNELGKKCLPLWQRIIDGTAEIWDGNNNVAKLNDDARAAEEEIMRLIYAAEAAENL